MYYILYSYIVLMFFFTWNVFIQIETVALKKIVLMYL